MKPAHFVLFLVLAIATASSAQSPPAAVPDTAIHVVTYLDLLPNQAGPGRVLLVQQTLAERSQRGCRSSELLQEQGRSNHFLLVEAWGDGASLESYRATPEYLAFRTALQPAIGSPLDERRAQQITPPKAEGALK